MPGASLIYEFLSESRVPHTVVQDRSTSTVRDLVASTRLSGRDVAKVVTCLIDGEPIEAVIPASLSINLKRLLILAGGSEIRLATEEEAEQRQPTCEPETVPDLDALYWQSVFVDVALVCESEIVFTAGPVPDVICVRWADFAKRVRPIVGKFAEPPLIWARCRLSPRE